MTTPTAPAVCEYQRISRCTGPADIQRVGRSGETGKRIRVSLCAECAAAIDAIPEWRT